ncbi:MAG: Gfo/Idh/MocA family oxidoreductase [Sedimentisphaerales bacterium]|nr:Gfo/Idh/MocA family oxidoreductase [Sedimentisphaerales bacterium]
MSQTYRRNESDEETPSLSRRRFLAGAAAASFVLATPGAVRTYAANSKVNLGLIGCGGRGGWIADLFVRHGGFNVTAVADYFPDRTNGVGDRFNVPASRRHTGLSGYRKLLEQVDAVAIESPPYFHPEQAATAVNAGKHVYLAKPIAVDTAGCLSVADSGKRASEQKLCFLVDFQTRADPYYIEALRRVHEAKAIGAFAFGEANYQEGDPFGRMVETWQADPQNPENRLRAWGLDKLLSGDIITEQNIHTLDVMNWIMGQPPIHAVGTGGRKYRSVGTCYDTFSVLFQYPDHVGVTFNSRQFEGHGSQPEGIRNRMFGDQGVLETAYGGQVIIRGQNFYRGGRSPGIYEEGAVANIKTFHDSITAGKFDNPTVEPSVQSNLITILGRTAAYEQRLVTWSELLAKKEKLDAGLKGLKA